MTQDPNNKPVIFFDGVCGLCNHFIDFVMRHDSNGKFLVAALQGKTAEQKLGKQPENIDPSSIILLNENGKISRSSTAVLEIMGRFGGIWSLSRVLLWVPSFIRESVYFFIAKNRYAWFGKRDTCRMPTPEEQARFLE